MSQEDRTRSDSQDSSHASSSSNTDRTFKPYGALSFSGYCFLCLSVLPVLSSPSCWCLGTLWCCRLRPGVPILFSTQLWGWGHRVRLDYGRRKDPEGKCATTAQQGCHQAFPALHGVNQVSSSAPQYIAGTAATRTQTSKPVLTGLCSNTCRMWLSGCHQLI